MSGFDTLFLSVGFVSPAQANDQQVCQQLVRRVASLEADMSQVTNYCNNCLAFAQSCHRRQEGGKEVCGKDGGWERGYSYEWQAIKNMHADGSARENATALTNGAGDLRCD